MCHGSSLYYTKVEAIAGTTYHVSNGGDVGETIAILHRPEDGYDHDARIKCAVCIEEPALVTFLAMPYAVRRRFGIAGTLTAFFVPGSAKTRTPDLIKFGDTVIPLNDFIGDETRLEVVALGVSGGMAWDHIAPSSAA